MLNSFNCPRPRKQTTTDFISGQSKVKQSIDLLKQKIKHLQKQLVNNKIFLNMVIHDMRNPTNSIEFAIKEVLKLLAEVTVQDETAPGSPAKKQQGNFKLRAIPDKVEGRSSDYHMQAESDQFIKVPNKESAAFGGGNGE